MPSRRTLLVACLVMLLPATPLLGQEWTRFRGPNGSGHGEAKNLPSEWTAKDYLWQAELPGVGHSSPVLWGQKLFVTSGNEESGARMVHCLNSATGTLLWSREFSAPKHKKHLRNSFASSTPVVDERRVYTCWGTPEDYIFLALDHEGNEAWRRDLGPYGAGHGSGSSPILLDDMLILSNDKNRDSYLVALDRASGETRWKLARSGTRGSYATPCVYQPPGQDPLVIFTEWMQGITAIDPRQGTKVWETDVFGDDEQRRSIGSPVIYGELVIGSCGFTNGKKFVVAVRPTSAGGNSSAAVEEVYRVERNAPQIPTVLVKDDLLFMWGDNGIVTCVSAATGKMLWQQRVGGNFSGSPICVENRLYAIDEEGVVVVLAAADKYELLASNSLDDASRSTPAVANNTLYLRTFAKLFAISGKE